MGLADIVNVQITRGTKTVSRAGFGTALVLGPNAFAGEVRSYSKLADVAADFATNTSEYKAAASYFGQELKPRKLKIGKRSAQVAQVETLTPTVQNSTVYTVTIDGVVYTYTSDADATAAEIVAGLLALIDADTNCPADASGTTTLILTAKVAGTGFSIEASANLAIAHTTANNGVVEDIAAAELIDSDWYMLILASRTDQDIMNAAGKIETMRRMYAACTEASGVKSNGTTDVGYKLKQKAYTRTFLLWSDDQETYPEAGWAGGLLPRDPGSETWKFKSIVGSLPSKLTPTEENNLKSKNVNYYMEIGGVNITTEGYVAVGEFIDVIRFIDWLHARLTEAVYQRLVSSPKVHYTDSGVSRIEADIRGVLQEGIAVGGLTEDPAPEVIVPKVADVPVPDRATRLLPDVEFNATLAGAIHAVEISGVVSV